MLVLALVLVPGLVRSPPVLVLTVASVLGVPGGVRRASLYIPGGGQPEALRMRDYVRAHPLYAQRLVSADERTALIIVQFEERDSEAGTE